MENSMRDLGAQILTGDEAQEAFSHLVLRDPDEMRKQTAEAFRNIKDIFAAQGLMLSAIIRRDDN